MKDYNTLFNQIPIEYDLFALILFANILFSYLIFIAVLFKNNNKITSFFKYAILALALIQTDFFLGYTGLMKYALWVNDSTNVLALLIPVILYFFISSGLKQVSISLRQNWIHLIMPCLYLMIQLGILTQSNEFRINNYIAGFHPNLSPIPVETPTSIWYLLALYVDDRFHQLLTLSFLFYSILIVKMLRSYNRIMRAQISFSTKKVQAYRFFIFLTILFIITTIVSMIVYSKGLYDFEERYIIIFPMLSIFFISYLIISSSYFFDSSYLLDKYHSTRLSVSSEDTFQKVIAFVQENKYYLKKDASLNDLAIQLSISPVYLSQIINSKAEKNFNTFINHYRIEEAKKRLVDDAYSHLDIASIGETVGFKSRSSFYAVFKKHVQITPAAYAKSTKK